jgi:FkbM family methyltransferase
MPSIVKKLSRFVALHGARLLYPSETLKIKQCTIGENTLLVPVNQDVGRCISVLGLFEEGDTKILRALSKPTDVCLDIGANCGYYTLLMATQADRGQVIAFEPTELYVLLMKASFAINGLKNISIQQCVVSNQVGTVQFNEAVDGAYSSMLPTGRTLTRAVLRVPCTTVDATVEAGGFSKIDLMKVDVEGAELLVLQGADSLLRNEQRRPRAILLELFDRNLSAYGHTVEQVLEFLKERGYQPFVVDKGERFRGYRVSDKNVIYNVWFLEPSQVDMTRLLS